MKLNILILSQFYHPEPLSTSHQLAESLHQRGHRVTAITAFPNYPEGSIYPGYRVRPWKIERLNGVRVIRLPVYPDHSRSSFRRILNYTSFALSACLLGPLMAGRTDVIYVSHPPNTIGIAAVVVGLLRRAPFLYGVHDIWPDSIVETGMLREGLATRVLRWMERFVYARAAAIGVASPGYIENLVGKGVPRDKIHLLTDWVDDATYSPVPPDPDLARETGMEGRFNVVFGGGLGLAQGLETVVEAASLLRDDPEVQFVFAGEGVARPQLEAAVREKTLSNVRFLGRLAPAEVRRIYAISDVLLVHLKAGFFSSTNMPAKIYAYLASGKPVLMAMGGAAAAMVRTAGAGLTCAPEDPRAMVKAVRRMQRMTAEERQAMGAAGRKTFLEHYDRDVVVTLHEEVLTRLGNKA